MYFDALVRPEPIDAKGAVAPQYVKSVQATLLNPDTELAPDTIANLTDAIANILIRLGHVHFVDGGSSRPEPSVEPGPMSER